MFSLNYSDAVPVSEQVKDGLRRLVVTGAVEPGEALPSVGAMSVALAINPTTVRKACEALEREGYLRILPDGKNYTPSRDGEKGERRRKLLESFDKTAAELLFLGLTAEELTARVASWKGGRA